MARVQRNYLEINSKEAAAQLTKLKQLTFIQPFLGQEATISEAASQVSVQEHQMQYFVNKMLKLGLMTVLRQEKRSGKPLKFYRCVADSFFIPLDHAPHVNLRSYFSELASVMLEEQITYQAKATLKKHEEERFGFWISQDAEANSVRFQLMPLSRIESQDSSLAPSLAEAPSFIGVGRIKLTKETAQKLRDSLKQFNEIPEESEGEYYFYRVALTPVIED